MSDYSAMSEAPYEGLRRRNVEALLDVLIDVRSSDGDYVRRRYEENASDFLLTVEGLEQLGLIRRDGGAILSKLTAADHHARRRQFGHWLIGRLLERQHFSKPLFAYLSAFGDFNGQIAWRAGLASSDHYAAVRDVLMDTRAVTVDIQTGEYYLSREFSYLYGLVAASRGVVSPEALQRTVASRDEVGYRAELAVIDYERRRLGEPYCNRVVHTAANDVSAGYDVTSVSIYDAYIIPRFIEVKAVSAKDYGFFWTANEVRVARTLGTCYFLYLVPMAFDGACLDGLKTIQDPCVEVLRTGGPWSIANDVLSCRLAAKV